MFAPFDDPARKVMERATAEARRFHHQYIGTEHLLLALIGVECVAAALARLGVTADRVTREVEKIVQHGPAWADAPRGRLPHTPRAKKVIEYAIEEARAHGDRSIGTGHLLVGLFREGEGVASHVLQDLGVMFDLLRAAVRGVPGPPPEPPREPPADPQARGVYDLLMAARARKEAAIEAQDFELAARCRDEEMALRRELARLLDPPDR